MQTEARKKVTVITEAALEHRLVTDLEALGVHGYTVTDARGKGSRGVRGAGWASNSNIRLEVVCDARLATSIAAHLKTHYYDDYAMILYLGDVTVLRPEKF